MTTACGSTISSQDSPQTLSLEEAPFREYLKILRKEGYEKEAEEVEREFSTMFQELGYTDEQLYETSFKNVQKVIEIYINEFSKQLEEAASNQNTHLLSISGQMMAGAGAAKLSQEQLMYLAQRQQQLTEEAKMTGRLG